MKASGFSGGAFIKADDAKTPFKATIVTTEVSEFKDNTTGRVQRKLVLVVDKAGEEKKLTLNKTNLDTLVGGFGDETDLWPGKVMALYFDPNVEYGGKKIGGVRIKLMGVKSKAELALEAQRAAEKLMETAFEEAGGPEPGKQPGDESENDDLPI